MCQFIRFAVALCLFILFFPSVHPMESEQAKALLPTNKKEPFYPTENDLRCESRTCIPARRSYEIV